MNTRNKLLETCLARLAAGESLETCLADYPDEAAWLRPLLTAADQALSLPAQQLRPAVDQTIEKQLRQAARQISQANQSPIPPLRQRPFHFMEEGMKNISRFLGSWLPRIVVAGAAVALLFIFVTQFTNWLPTLSNPIAEPAAEVATTELTIDTVGDTTITLEADLTADPGEVPLYHVSAEPVPNTPEDALAWAQEFGLPDPEVYRSANESDPSLYVLGSDGQRLSFQNYDAFSDISYSNEAISATSGEPISFEEASTIAINFLRGHNVLPANYQVEPAQGNLGPMQMVIIYPQVEGGFIRGDSAALRVSVSSEGQVVYATLSKLVLEQVGTTTVISAQQAYDDLLNGRNVTGSSYGIMRPINENENYRYYEAPSPSLEVGQTVDLVGYLNVLLNVQTGEQRLTLTTPEQTFYQLTGRSIEELGSAPGTWGNIHVEGTITAQTGPNRWQVAIEAWETASPFVGSCLIGALSSTGDAAQFHSVDGETYPLPNAPEEIAVGESMQICLSAPAEPGSELSWVNIQVPPPGEGLPPGGMVSEQVSFGGVSSGGSGGSGIITEQVIVEEVQEVQVTRTVIESVGDSPSSGLTMIPGSSAESVPPFIEPTNPYEIGDEVELIGTVHLHRILTESGEERLEATFANESDQGEASYPLTYSLLASQELLAEMAEFNQLHVRVYGRIAPAPDSDEMFFATNSEQAIEVDSFDRPWPDERLERFLGHLSIGELEGQQVLLFTDHATDQQYVINPPDLPPQAYENDPTLEEEQILVTGIVHPTDTFGGLPLLEHRGTGGGTDIAQATDISQLPLHEGQQLPVINEADLRRRDGLAGIIRGDVVIERVTLVYLYQPQPRPDGNVIEAVSELSEPVWAFYGRSVDGLEQFTIHVRATIGN